MLTKVYCSAVFGVEATTIVVEVNIDKGIGYHLVGLPDNAIKESNYRIAAALQNNGYKIPGKKITINISSENSDTFSKLKSSTEHSDKLITTLTSKPFIGQVTDNSFKIISSK